MKSSGCWGVGALGAMVKYRGVSRPTIKGVAGKWLAQHKNNPRVWKKGFRTQRAAAEWLADKLGVDVSDMEAKTALSSQLPMSVHHGVVAHRRDIGRATMWEARHLGKLISSHTSELGAARVVAKLRRTSVDNIRKDEPMTRNMGQQLFSATHSVFHSYNPGDLANLQDIAISKATMLRQELSGI